VRQLLSGVERRLMSEDLLDKLVLRASTLREYLDGPESGRHLSLFDRFPEGCCKLSSIFFLKLIVDLDRIGGGFLVANAERGEARHAWSEVGGWIVDLTADQFGDCDDPCLVARTSQWHDSWTSAERFPASGYGLHDAQHLKEYGGCLDWMRAPPNSRQCS